MITSMNDECAVVFNTKNVNTAFYQGLHKIYTDGEKLNTRNGVARVLPCPLITHYENPTERVLFLEERNANPFFHLVEACWMLAGKNDVNTVAYYSASMRNYSDNGRSLNGAYGYRWRYQFNNDQVETIISILQKDPSSRRVVLQMWDTNADLVAGMNGSKDVCCNMLVKYRIINGRLCAYVINRSNDMLFGGYGANVFHFSFLQEYIADRLGVAMGGYEQISLDAHLYTGDLYGQKLWSAIEPIISSEDRTYVKDPYKDGNVFSISPLTLRVSSRDTAFSNKSLYWMNDKAELFYKTFYDGTSVNPEVISSFDNDLNTVLNANGHNIWEEDLSHRYIINVLLPVMRSYHQYKAGNISTAIDLIDDMSRRVSQLVGFNNHVDGMEFDISKACKEWLIRRLDK